MTTITVAGSSTYVCEAVEACPKLDRVNDRLGKKEATQLTLNMKGHDHDHLGDRGDNYDYHDHDNGDDVTQTQS